MRLWIFICVITLFYFAPPAHADGLFLEGGAGLLFSKNTEAVFLRYQKDAGPLFHHESFYDFSFASWNGPNHDDAVAITRGLKWNWKERNYFSFEAGGAYLKRTSDNLGTRLQFAFRFAFGVRAEKFDISIGYNHISNGKFLFGWSGPNNGENFLSLQIGRVF